MTQQDKNIEFDFSKIISSPIKNLERQSYKKVMFLAIGLSVFMTLGISVKQGISNKIDLYDAIESKKNTLSFQEIKKMSDSDFDSLIQQSMKSSTIYDEKAHFIQSIVAKAEVENYKDSMNTTMASSLGSTLEAYKQNLLNDCSKLILVRRNVMNNLPVSSEDAELLLKYQTAYKTKSFVRSKSLEDSMQEILYSKFQGNNQYNTKNNIYDTIKVLDQKINNSLNTIEAPKPNTIEAPINNSLNTVETPKPKM